jgi:hypothetical protein
MLEPGCRWRCGGEAMSEPSALPYTDTKPVGAADFYTAINATFRFVFARFGREGLRRYWADLGSRYHAPVSQRWAKGGLPAVAQYWREFFAAEPGGEVEVHEQNNEVRLEVRRCPAIAHLRAQGREIAPYFCQHCYFVGEAMAQPAGLSLRVCGGGGSCSQVFRPAVSELAPQNLEDIATLS